jgi:hypothetical protein
MRLVSIIRTATTSVVRVRQEDEISWWKEKTSSTIQYALKEDNAEFMDRIMMEGSEYESCRLNLDGGAAPPNCTAPPLSDNNSTEGMGSNNASTVPEFTNFTGIVMVELIGRLPVRRNETLLLEEALLQVYRNLSTCSVKSNEKRLDDDLIPWTIQKNILNGIVFDIYNPGARQ